MAPKVVPKVIAPEALRQLLEVIINDSGLLPVCNWTVFCVKCKVLNDRMT